MKSKFILDLDLTASIEANMEFLDRCEKEIKRKRKNLNEMMKPKTVNQLDLEQESLKVEVYNHNVLRNQSCINPKDPIKIDKGV